MLRHLALAVVAICVCACGDDPLELLVDLRTDLVAPQELSRIRVILEPGGIEEVDAMDASYLDGLRVAEFADLALGGHTLVITLFDVGGPPLVERTVRIDLRETTALTVLVSRDCREVACGDALSCRAGECVDETCSDLAPDLCPAPECDGDSDCASASACASARCLADACLYEADDAMCGMDEWCSPDDGCLALPGTTPGVEGVVYTVADGYVLDAPLALDDATKASLLGPSRQIAFPMPGSSFPVGPYVGVSGDPDMGIEPIVVRFEGGAATTFATSDGSSGPDQSFSQMQFSDSATPWGDFLYVCSASSGGGDGLFTVDSTGTFAIFDSFNNCNGLVFDYDQTLGDPGFVSPAYVNVNSTEYSRYASDATNVSLTTGLPFEGSGFKAHVARGGAFVGAMYIVSPGDAAPSDGSIVRVDTVEPWAQTPWASGLADPGTAAFGDGGPLGDFFFVPLRTSGEVYAYELDGTFTVVVSDLLEPRAVVRDGDALWILEAGRGQVLRLRATL
ncbi:MAG: hypothetical protein JRH11_08625 [Deltaproteobacteria bacterium]|nr:hypothetical protein [Deltaproteobacteria bacterium]